jgi:Bacterial DNA polymerase III alpha subunit.
MKVQGNRYINQDGEVHCNLNAVVYAMNCGADLQYLKLMEMDEFEREKFNDNCKKFGLEYRMLDYTIEHDKNHELWKYDPAYDNLNLEEYFLGLCETDAQKARVLEELALYESYNMNKLLRCMIWLVDYLEENKIFWGLGRGSSVSSYCLYLLGLHLVDSLKYELDVNEFLKW